MQISHLEVYPVKSCKGIPVQTAIILETGFAYDRRWVVTNERGRFRTQRDSPKLALISTSLPEEALLGEWGQLPPDAALTLTAPGMEPLQVPLSPLPRPGVRAVRRVVVWEWEGEAEDEGDEAADWFSDFLGKRCRLARYIGKPGIDAVGLDRTRRTLDPNWVPSGGETAFADAFPFLLANEASLRDLNSRLGQALPMNRFRPNIVVEGCDPWAEDGWVSLKMGSGALLTSVKPCDRCKVTQTDQETGEVGREPLVTLGTFRSGRVLGWSALPSWNKAVFFGWNLVPQTVGDRLSVGDPVQILKQRPDLAP
eukprot:jgi/Botrbrau1/19576/Bobra.0035s0061.1